MESLQTDLHLLAGFWPWTRVRPQQPRSARLPAERAQGFSLLELLVIGNPARKVIYCSASAGAISARFDSSWFFSGASFAQQGMSPGIEHPAPRNGGGAASLFADGHVEKLDVKSMDRPTRQRYFVPDP
jgi:prepilin-type processing-associated H-X9-DG protein